MPDTPRPALPRHWLSFLTRRAVVAATLVAVAAGLVGHALVSRLPVLHAATATILINPLEGNAYRPGGSGEDLINLTTEAEVLRSDAVAERVAEAMPGVQEPEALLGALDVAVLTNTQILELTFTDEDADVAVTGAQTFADQFLEYRVARAQASITDQTNLLGAQISKREDELSALAAELATVDPDSSQATLLDARMQTITAQITQLTAQVADLAATTLDPGQAVAYATVDAAGPLSPQVIVPAAAALLGAAGVLGLAFIWSLRNWRVRRPRDLAALDVAVLAVVREETAVLSPWDEPVQAELAELRRSLLPQFSGEARRAVLVAAARPSATTASVAIARAAGQAGLDVIVVDTTTHLRMPGDTAVEGGTFAELLNARSDVEPTLVPGPDNVRALATGAPLDPVALSLRGASITEVLHTLWLTSDLVVLHADRVDTDLGRALAAACHNVVLETPLGVTHAAGVRSAAEACSDVGARILGAVVVEPVVEAGPLAGIHGPGGRAPVPNWRRREHDRGARPAAAAEHGTPDTLDTLDAVFAAQSGGQSADAPEPHAAPEDATREGRASSDAAGPDLEAAPEAPAVVAEASGTEGAAGEDRAAPGDPGQPVEGPQPDPAGEVVRPPEPRRRVAGVLPPTVLRERTEVRVPEPGLPEGGRAVRTEPGPAHAAEPQLPAEPSVAAWAKDTERG